MNEQNVPQNVPYTILPTSPLAIVSMVAGILGFMGLPIIASIVAILTGYLARKETRSSPPQAAGDGMATAGIIMGWVQIALSVVAICCFILYFVFVIGIVSKSR
jgi:hypothetical protein